MIAAVALGIAFVGFLVFFLVMPFTISLAANDLYATGVLGRYAERLVHVAARAVPAPERDRRLRDWLADLDTTSSQLLKLWYAVNILVASRAVGAALKRRPGTIRKPLASILSLDARLRALEGSGLWFGIASGVPAAIVGIVVSVAIGGGNLLVYVGACVATVPWFGYLLLRVLEKRQAPKRHTASEN